MKKTICQLLSAMLLVAGCSRPVAYFQRGPVQHYNTPKTETVAVVPAQITQSVDIVAPVPTAISAPAEPVVQAKATVSQLEAYVRNDSKQMSDKTLTKRMNRVKTMLASASTNRTLAPTATKAPRQMNVAERLLLKKINKKIGNHLAPSKPDKTMINGGLLTGGVILVLAGLLLIVLTSGTASTIGVIALLVGALALVLGLIAS